MSRRGRGRRLYSRRRRTRLRNRCSLLGVSLLIFMVKGFSKGSAGAVGDTKRGEVACVSTGAETRLRAIVTIAHIAVLIVARREEIVLVEAGSVGDARVHERCGAGVAA